MKKSHARRQTSVAVPPQLAGLLALAHEQIDTNHADDMGRALNAARAMLRDALRHETFDDISAFVTAEAARGGWKDLHRAIVALDRPEDSPLNATSGDIFNVYSGPSVLIGMALAYVYLAEGGTR
jgi:hypothetical protein